MTPDHEWHEKPLLELQPYWIGEDHTRFCMKCPHCGVPLVVASSASLQFKGEDFADFSLLSSLDVRGHFHAHMLHGKVLFVVC